jgi:hypothetical protein
MRMGIFLPAPGGRCNFVSGASRFQMALDRLFGTWCEIWCLEQPDSPDINMHRKASDGRHRREEWRRI